MRPTHRLQAGFTLIEVIISLGIVSIITIALASTFLLGYRTVSQESSQISADQAVSGASLSLTRDLSSATISSPLPDTLLPGGATLVLTYGAPPTTVTYRINGSNQLIRTVGLSSRVAARGVASLKVASGAPACFLTVTILPSASGAVARTLNVGERPGGCF